jgi:hypothetical protein
VESALGGRNLPPSIIEEQSAANRAGIAIGSQGQVSSRRAGTPPALLHCSSQFLGDLLVEDFADGEGDDHLAAPSEEGVDFGEAVLEASLVMTLAS